MINDDFEFATASHVLKPFVCRRLITVGHRYAVDIWILFSRVSKLDEDLFCDYTDVRTSIYTKNNGK